MKKKINILVSLIVTALLIFAIFREQSLEEFLEIFYNVNLNLVAVYAAISILALFFRALRYHWMLKGLISTAESLKFRQLLIVTAIRNALVDLLPARLGELAYLYVLKNYGVKLVAGATTFGLCTVLDIVVLLFMFFCLLLYAVLSSEGMISSLFTAGAEHVYLFLLVFTIILLISTFFIMRMEWFFYKVAALSERVGVRAKGKLSVASSFISDVSREIGRELVNIKSSGDYPKLVFVTFLLRLAKYGSLYILLVAVISGMGYGFSDIEPLVSFVAFIAAEAAASLPFSGIMGFGAYEGAWSMIFSLSEIRLVSTASVILAVHIITQILGYSVGVVGLLFFGFSQFANRR